MNVEFVRDASGKLNAILIDGKKVKTSFVRGWNKAEKTPYWKEFTSGATFTNPFSGVRVTLNWLEATIYNFCRDWYRFYSYGMPTGVPIQTYDDMKYFLLDLNSDAYMDLLD